MYAYLPNQLRIEASIPAKSVSATENGAAIDISDTEGSLLVVVSSPVASASDTVTYTVQHSYNGTTGWEAVPAAALIDPETGAPDTFTQVTDAVAVFETLGLKRDSLRRFVRVVATIAGSTVTAIVSGYIIAQRKYTEYA
jgi:hypothetical protein